MIQLANIKLVSYKNFIYWLLLKIYYIYYVYLKYYEIFNNYFKKYYFIILQIIGQYNEAKNDFEHILIYESHYIPALKGLAETCLALAKEYTAKQFLGRANDCLQQAMNSLIIAIKERKDTSCIWKLLGDICYRVAILPEKYSYLKVSSILIKYEDIENIVLLKKQDMFSLSIRYI